jgi:hypothetical protein
MLCIGHRECSKHAKILRQLNQSVDSGLVRDSHRENSIGWIPSEGPEFLDAPISAGASGYGIKARLSGRALPVNPLILLREE